MDPTQWDYMNPCMGKRIRASRPRRGDLLATTPLTSPTDRCVRDPWASIMADLLELRREAGVLRGEFQRLGADADQLGLHLRLVLERSRQL